jgi:hypothetical protein
VEQPTSFLVVPLSTSDVRLLRLDLSCHGPKNTPSAQYTVVGLGGRKAQNTPALVAPATPICYALYQALGPLPKKARKKLLGFALSLLPFYLRGAKGRGCTAAQTQAQGTSTSSCLLFDSRIAQALERGSSYQGIERRPNELEAV